MPIKFDENRSDQYIGTFQCNDPDDMDELATLRRLVKNLNKMVAQAGYEYKFRLDVMGRLGPDNPNAYKYRGRGYNSHQYIKIGDAASVDAYIRRRYM